MAESVTDYYDGSRMFEGLTGYVGVSVDKINFIVCQLSALLLASLFRTKLHSSKTSPIVRQSFSLLIGLLIGYICFGRQAIHLAALPASCYVIIRTQSPHIMQRLVLVFSLLYLSGIHIHRMIYDYGSYHLDITGPLMVITQKVTSLAFNIHDGLTKSDEEMNKGQKQYAVTRVPNSLEYFSYVLHFPSLMAGPVIYYRDYVDFIEGTQLKMVTNDKEAVAVEPSPTRAIIKKLLIAGTSAVLFIKFLPHFPMSRIKETDFLENTSITQKFIYLYIGAGLVRAKYYFAWTLSDAICNNAGIGYNGNDEHGRPKWDKVTNVDILKFEFATNLRESIDAWNLGTNVWFRMIAYERAKKHKLLATYLLSAIWHGFYPGYYFTFAGGALFTVASRVVRRNIRNYFLANSETKFFYDAITFVVTRLLMAYLIFTFIILEFWPCVRLYTHMYWSIHIIAVVCIVAIPRIVPKTTPSQAAKTSIAQAFVPMTNGVSRHHD